MITDRDGAYPVNVASAAFDGERDGCDWLESGIRQAMATLPSRAQDVLRLRYADGLTLEATGKAIGVSRVRVRQIEAKAFAMLRHPSRARMMAAVGYDEHERVMDALYKAEQRIAWLEKTINALTCQIEPVATDRPLTGSHAQALATPLEDMGLSVRAYNCCKRASLQTAGDIARLSRCDLLNIRNMGRQSIDELADRLDGLGLALKGEEGK